MSKFESKSELNCMQQEFRTCLEGSFENLEGMIDEYCCDGRYKSLSLTFLEQAAMWANKSICHEWEGK